MLNMIAIARCLVEPKFDSPGLLKAILRDEYIIWCKVQCALLYNVCVLLFEVYCIVIISMYTPFGIYIRTSAGNRL